MCGIVLLCGPQASLRLPECLSRLQHRGPDDRHIIVEGDIALGFTRLAINGGAIGRQPYRHGDFIGAINGEIYNHQALAEEHQLPPYTNDTHVVLPLFERCGLALIDRLDGFYAGVILRLATRELFCLRDPLGKKPLFLGRSQSEWFIASELKVFDQVDEFVRLPRGISRVDLATGRVTQVTKHCPLPPQQDVVSLFGNAVRKRMPQPDQRVGVFLSGGLDSALIAAFVARLRDDAIYFTLGNADSDDYQAVATVAAALGLKDLRTVPLPTPEEMPALVKLLVHTTESYNPSIVSNGLATYLLAEAAQAAGVKVVLTGEGADELFGGYHHFQPSDSWRAVRSQLIDDLQYTELRRLDLATMAHGVEARCPFLDAGVRRFSDDLAYHQMYCGEENKVTLRRCFTGVLPPVVLERRKTSFDVGSGIRGRVVKYLRRRGRSEREELSELWQQHFAHDAANPYFHAYPVFDTAIDHRGMVHR